MMSRRISLLAVVAFALSAMPAAALIIATVATPASAQDGCGKFNWKLDKEHALLTSPAAAKTRNGAEFNGLPATALVLNLEPSDTAKMAMAPERAPKSPSSFAGFVQFAGTPQGRPLLVTLSAEAWVDVVQGGRYVKSVGSSGVRDCPTMRKSVRFDLAPGPFAVQVSGVAAETIGMAVTPANQ